MYEFQTINKDHLQMELVQNEVKTDYLLLQVHGGGFQFPISLIYRKNAHRCKKLLEIDVLTPDYRTSPQYQYPCALDDVFLAWEWAIEHGYKAQNIILMGDSAGGNLALALALKLKKAKLPMPAAMVFMSPFVDLSLSFDSHKRNLDVDLFFNHKRGTNPFVQGNDFWRMYAGNMSLNHEFVSPYFGDLSELSPTLIQVGTREVLEDDSIMLYEKMKEAHVDVTLTRYENMYHVFQLSDLARETKAAWQEVRLFIENVLKKAA